MPCVIGAWAEEEIFVSRKRNKTPLEKILYWLKRAGEWLFQNKYGDKQKGKRGNQQGDEDREQNRDWPTAPLDNGTTIKISEGMNHHANNGQSEVKIIHFSDEHNDQEKNDVPPRGKGTEIKVSLGYKEEPGAPSKKKKDTEKKKDTDVANEDSTQVFSKSGDKKAEHERKGNNGKTGNSVWDMFNPEDVKNLFGRSEDEQ